MEYRGKYVGVKRNVGKFMKGKAKGQRETLEIIRRGEGHREKVKKRR